MKKVKGIFGAGSKRRIDKRHSRKINNKLKRRMHGRANLSYKI